MEKPGNTHRVGLELIGAWLGARSVARGLPAPVADHGGMRVDTGLPNEVRRYVFAGPVDGIRELAASIDVPHVPIKMCGPADQLLALLPSGWTLQPPGYLMTRQTAGDAMPVLPAGYRVDMAIDGQVAAARIIAGDGALAASGYAAEHAGVFIFDRIATDAAHRRRGLGKALMAALGSTRRSSASQQVLVATEEGRALYATLGWRVLAPYSTAVILAAVD